MRLLGPTVFWGKTGGHEGHVEVTICDGDNGGCFVTHQVP